MKFRVSLTDHAERDIQEIFRYIAEHDSMATAERVLSRIEDAVIGLSWSPLRGHVPKELHGLGITEFREVHYKPYRIIYRVVGRTVLVDCVVDGRRDMQSLLQRRLLS